MTPESVDDYLSGLSGQPAATAMALRAAILGAAPELSESIKWAQPVYEVGGPVCYFKAATAHVTFGFFRGAELRELEPHLQSGGSRMAHLKLRSPEDIGRIKLAELLAAAIALNRSEGNPTRRKAGPA